MKYFLFLFLLFLYVIVIGAFFIKRKSVSRKVLSELLSIVAILFLFVFTATISSVTNKVLIKRVVIINVCLAIAVVLLLFALCEEYSVDDIKKRLNTLKISLNSNRCVIICLLITALLRIGQFGTLQHWDGFIYYSYLQKACQNFNFSIDSFFVNFKLAGHPTLGIASLTAIGEFLFPSQFIGVQAVLLIITLAALVCLYKLLLKMFPYHKKSTLAIAVLFISVTPIFLGLFSHFQTDYGLILFFIFVIYYYSEKKNILMIFWLLMLCQTKETGIIWAFGFLGMQMIYCAIKSFSNKKEMVKSFFFNKYMIIAISLGIVFLVVTYVLGESNRWLVTKVGEEVVDTPFEWSSEGWNCFDIRPNYIWNKLKQVFVLNFNWILWIGILICLIIKRKYKIKFAERISQFGRLAVTITACIIANIVFLLIYMSGLLARYDMAWVVALSIIFVILLLTVFNKKINNIVLLLLAALFTVQAYITIDPLTKALYQDLETGQIDMVYVNSIDKDITNYGDFLAYNNQYTFLDKAIDQILKETSFDENTQVAICKNNYGININGTDNWGVLYWDKEKQKRVYKKNENTIYISSYLADNIDIVADYELKENVVILFIPYFKAIEEEYISKISEYYDIGERNTCKIGLQGEIVYYTGILKN